MLKLKKKYKDVYNVQREKITKECFQVFCNMLFFLKKKYHLYPMILGHLYTFEPHELPVVKGIANLVGPFIYLLFFFFIIFSFFRTSWPFLFLFLLLLLSFTFLFLPFRSGQALPSSPFSLFSSSSLFFFLVWLGWFYFDPTI